MGNLLASSRQIENEAGRRDTSKERSGSVHDQRGRDKLRPQVRWSANRDASVPSDELDVGQVASDEVEERKRDPDRRRFRKAYSIHSNTTTTCVLC